MKVVLLNRDFGWGVPPQRMQGISGVTYGISRYVPAERCHVVELTLEQFDKCWDDVQRTIAMRMRCWYPKFIVEPAVKQFAEGYEAGMDKKELPEGATFATQSGWTAAHANDQSPAALTHAAQGEPASVSDLVVAHETGGAAGELPIVNASMKFPQLRKIAKIEGSWDDSLKGQGNKAVVAAILAKRLQPA